MKLQWESHRSGTVVQIAGELVSDDVDVLRRRCEEHITPGIRLIADLRECERLDSAGLEALLWMNDHVHGFGGHFRLVLGGGQPEAAITVTRLNRRVPVHRTLESAAKSFAKGQVA